jgi:uncharacterized protein YndB with AHSA1/START domain
VIPFTVESFISAPREDVFDFVGDLAMRVSWLDHFQSEYHLTRTRTVGKGAAARYRTDPPFSKQLYTGLAIEEFERPRRIVERGGSGRLGRTLVLAVWDFEADGPNQTTVRLEFETNPVSGVEAMKERFGSRLWHKRQYNTALERLRIIFEERPQGELARATIAAYEPLKAPRFGS